MPSTGKVYVDKPEVLDDLIGYSTKDLQTSSLEEASGKFSKYSAGSSNRSKKSIDENQRSLLQKQNLAEFQKVAAATKANVERALRKNAMKKDIQFQALLSDVEETKKLLLTIDQTLELEEEANRNKIRHQFEDWNNKVHGKIQKNIIDQVNNLDYKTLNRKRNEDYEKYLNITNRKAAIFRDIIIESEYDPLEPNRRAIKARTGKIKDPTKLPIQKAEEEAAMLESGDPGSRRGVEDYGKYTLPVEQWAQGKIDATPHGRFAKMMAVPGEQADARNRSSAEHQALMASHIEFDHFKVATGRDVVDKEMPKGKRVFPASLLSANMGEILSEAK